MMRTAPKAQGLYDPQNEHDACGIGAVVDISGAKSHKIVTYGKQILLNLQHRGASGADESTGDGAGIQIQIPARILCCGSRPAEIRLAALGPLWRRYPLFAARRRPSAARARKFLRK